MTSDLDEPCRRLNSVNAELASVAGAVIQATGRLTFEDGMRSFVEVSNPESSLCICTNVWRLLDGSDIGDN